MKKSKLCNTSFKWYEKLKGLYACLVFYPIMVGGCAAFLVARRWVGRRALWWPRLWAVHFGWFGSVLLVCFLARRGPAGVFLLLKSWWVVRRPGVCVVGRLARSVGPVFLFIRMLIMTYLFVRDGSLTGWGFTTGTEGPTECFGPLRMPWEWGCGRVRPV